MTSIITASTITLPSSSSNTLARELFRACYIVVQAAAQLGMGNQQPIRHSPRRCPPSNSPHPELATTQQEDQIPDAYAPTRPHAHCTDSAPHFQRTLPLCPSLGLPPPPHPTSQWPPPPHKSIPINFHCNSSFPSLSKPMGSHYFRWHQYLANLCHVVGSWCGCNSPNTRPSWYRCPLTEGNCVLLHPHKPHTELAPLPPGWRNGIFTLPHYFQQSLSVP